MDDGDSDGDNVQRITERWSKLNEWLFFGSYQFVMQCVCINILSIICVKGRKYVTLEERSEAPEM